MTDHERTNIARNTVPFLAIGARPFLPPALGSCHPPDWPSHTVDPHPPTQNLCGTAGAFVAYYLFLGIGQGVFPMLFFSGVLLALAMFNNRVSDLWLRTIGLMLLCTAFAAAVHHLKPGSMNGFPEGHGGIVGIGTSAFLQTHFNTVGTRLILLVAILIGLLLAADDLVLRAPGLVGGAINHVKENTNLPSMPAMPSMAAFRFNFPALPKLPSLPRFVTKDAAGATSGQANGSKRTETLLVGEEDDEEKPAVILKRETAKPPKG